MYVYISVVINLSMHVLFMLFLTENLETQKLSSLFQYHYMCVCGSFSVALLFVYFSFLFIHSLIVHPNLCTDASVAVTSNKIYMHCIYVLLVQNIIYKIGTSSLLLLGFVFSFKHKNVNWKHKICWVLKIIISMFCCRIRLQCPYAVVAAYILYFLFKLNYLPHSSKFNPKKVVMFRCQNCIRYLFYFILFLHFGKVSSLRTYTQSCIKFMLVHDSKAHVKLHTYSIILCIYILH